MSADLTETPRTRLRWSPWRSEPRPRLPTQVYVLAMLNLFIGVGYGVAAPVIPVLAKTFDVSDLAASMVISLYAATRVVLAPLAARLALRFTPGLLMSVAMAVTALTSIMAAYSGSFVGLLLWRGLGGGGTAITTVAGQALLYRTAPAGQRGRASAVFHGGFLLGALVGPVVGGVVAAWSLAAPLAVYGGLLLTGAALSVWKLGLRAGGAGTFGGELHPGMSMREAWGDIRYRISLMVNFSNAWVGNGIRFTVVPLYVVGALELSPSWTGVGLMVAAGTQILLVVPAGRMTDRVSPRVPLCIGSAFSVAGSLVLVLETSLTGFLVAMGIFGVGYALISPASSALLADVLDGRGGAPLAWYQMTFDIATILAPLVSGLLSDQIGFAAAFMVATAVALVAAIFSWLTPSSGPQPHRRRSEVAPVPPQPE